MTWSVVLSDEAQRDFDDILIWTVDHFGERQALRYNALIELSIDGLKLGPHQLSVRPRPELGEGVAAMHIARSGQPARHVLYLRHTTGAQEIAVLRILHDSQDPLRHLPE